MLTITDLFCGAGGSTAGAVQVPGTHVRMAANHWQLAIETHNTNHPNTDHAAVDLHQEDPRHFPRTDLLWASPECTRWSQAGGSRNRTAIEEGLFEDPLSDEAANRSRLLMFDVLRFAEHHRYRVLIVENVVDIALQARYRQAWQVWRRDLARLGYHFRVVSLNSMHASALGAPAPQSRDRLYVVAWRQGERAPDLDRVLRPRAWCDRCDMEVEAQQAFKPDRTVGRYRQQYVYMHGACGQVVEPYVLPAAVAIDWSLKGERIGDRVRPLAPKTLARIEAGLRRCTIVSDGSNHAFVEPMLVPAGGTWNDYARPVSEPFRTRTTRESEALVVPLRNNGVARPATLAPLQTVAAGGLHHALVMRDNTARGDQGQMSAPVHEPPRPSLIKWDHMLVPYDRTSMPRCVTEPAPTQTTVQGDALVGPEARVEDCTFRMLEPHEIQRAMAFEPDYVVLGNKRERIKQLGNAVTPPAARDLVAAVVEAITGEEVMA